MQAPIVVIGRNEGERLRRCLLAALKQSETVVYVDSESADGSPELARSLGAEVIELGPDEHSVSSARNAGFRLLLGRNPDLEAVQFVDGDCELVEGWLRLALAELARCPQIGAVCGRRRERFPDASIFTRLCDLEWDAPTGEVSSFGGDVLIRAAAFLMVGGFNSDLLVGEDPELAFRVHRKGWKIIRMPIDMTVHDSNMTRFSQWWRRTMRGGHGYAECSWLHRLGPEHYWRREALTIWFWGVAVPIAMAGMAFVSPRFALLMLAGYPALAVKIYLWVRKSGRNHRDALLYATFCVLGKFPQAIGQMRFHANRLLRNRSRNIEYKSA